MKTTLALLALTLTFSSVSMASEGLIISSKLHEVLTLKKVSKTKFEKISSIVTGTLTVEASFGGEKFSETQDVNNSDLTNKVSIEVTGKNIVRIQNEKEKIDSEVQAEIDKSFMGTIRSIKIDAKTYEGLYAESMKKSGLDLLKKLRIQDSNGVGLSTSIEGGELACEAAQDLLICTQEAEVAIALTSK